MALKQALAEFRGVIQAALDVGLQPLDCRVTGEDAVVVYADRQDKRRIKVEFALEELGLQLPRDFDDAKRLQERIRRCFKEFVAGSVSGN